MCNSQVWSRIVHWIIQTSCYSKFDLLLVLLLRSFLSLSAQELSPRTASVRNRSHDCIHRIGAEAPCASIDALWRAKAKTQRGYRFDWPLQGDAPAALNHRLGESRISHAKLGWSEKTFFFEFQDARGEYFKVPQFFSSFRGPTLALKVIKKSILSKFKKSLCLGSRFDVYC